MPEWLGIGNLDVKGMMNRKVVAALLLLLGLFVAGCGVLARGQFGQVKAERVDHLLRQGQTMVNLLALQPFDTMDRKEQRFFVRSLVEHVCDDSFLYLAVEDVAGQAQLSLDPDSVLAKLQMPAIPSVDGAPRVFTVSGVQGQVYEFSKPIMGVGREGTIRLGYRFVPESPWAPKRMSLIAIVPFFMLASLVVGYQGFFAAAKGRLEQAPHLHDASMMTVVGEKPINASAGLLSIVTDLDRVVGDLNSRALDLSDVNARLVSQMGTVRFERKQVLRMLDGLDCGVLVTGLEDQVLHANQYVLELLGKTIVEVADHSIRDIVPVPELISFLSAQQDGGTVGSRSLDVELPDLAPQEVFRVACSFLKENGGTVVGKLIVVTNVTQTRRDHDVQQDFVAHLAHELRTPLTSIKAYTEMLMNDLVEDEEAQKEFYNTINDETDRLSQLIEDLLSISRMEAGMHDLDRGLVRTDWLLDACLPAIEASALQKNIRVDKKLPEQFPYLMGDKSLLKVVLVNILGNAVKYTPANGTVSLSLYEAAGMVHFEVLDTGCGIAEQDLPHIFEKFYRSHQEGIEEVTGTGLGLAIAANIVEVHGGVVEVESEMGKGTRFVLKLPKEEYQLESA